MFAARYGHGRVVELLLQRGADANLQDSDGGTALICGPSATAVSGWSSRLRGAEINKQSSTGRTALMLAAGHGQQIRSFLRRVAARRTAKRLTSSIN